MFNKIIPLAALVMAYSIPANAQIPTPTITEITNMEDEFSANLNGDGVLDQIILKNQDDTSSLSVKFGYLGQDEEGKLAIVYTEPVKLFSESDPNYALFVEPQYVNNDTILDGFIIHHNSIGIIEGEPIIPAPLKEKVYLINDGKGNFSRIFPEELGRKERI